MLTLRKMQTNFHISAKTISLLDITLYSIIMKNKTLYICIVLLIHLNFIILGGE
jgi:hypothetical protein